MAQHGESDVEVELAALVEERTGLHFSVGRLQQLERALQVRLEALKLADRSEYLQRLRSRPAEWDELIPLLVTPESYFERGKEQLRLLRDHILPRLLAQPGELLLWVAGCSTGEDAYTLAALLRDAGVPAQRATVLGTDINSVALAKAEQGVYGQWSFRDTSAEFRGRHFTSEAAGLAVHPSLRRRVRFQVHNILASGSLPCREGGCGLVLCRNVMIYWQRPTRQLALAQFKRALMSGGWLIAGHNEVHPRDAADFEANLIDGVLAFQKPASTVVTVRIPPAPPAPAPAAARAHSRQEVAHVAGIDLEGVRRLAGQGRIAEALDGCRSVAASQPASAETLHLLATLASEQGDSREAEGLLRQALYVDADFAPAYRDLALLLESQGRHTSAQRCRDHLARLLATGNGRFGPDAVAT
ncbi:MAG TPA: CheR family methyltransferase [Chloroflexota bacterium]|nr:CheR family methyltransferase [Chloroflexota bacterium]